MSNNRYRDHAIISTDSEDERSDSSTEMFASRLGYQTERLEQVSIQLGYIEDYIDEEGLEDLCYQNSKLKETVDDMKELLADLKKGNLKILVLSV